jgi:hypothetical protein
MPTTFGYQQIKASLFMGMLEELSYIDGQAPRSVIDHNARVIDHLQAYSDLDVRAVRESLWSQPPFARWIQERADQVRVRESA